MGKIYKNGIEYAGGGSPTIVEVTQDTTIANPTPDMIINIKGDISGATKYIEMSIGAGQYAGQRLYINTPNTTSNANIVRLTFSGNIYREYVFCKQALVYEWTATEDASYDGGWRLIVAQADEQYNTSTTQSIPIAIRRVAIPRSKKYRDLPVVKYTMIPMYECDVIARNPSSITSGNYTIYTFEINPEFHEPLESMTKDPQFRLFHKTIVYDCRGKLYYRKPTETNVEEYLIGSTYPVTSGTDEGKVYMSIPVIISRNRVIANIRENNIQFAPKLSYTTTFSIEDMVQ